MIVALVVLTLLVIAGQVERALMRRDHAREVARLTNAALARNPQEFVAMERQLDHKAPKRETEPAPLIEGLS